jgi:hypothetical protein
VEPVYCCAKSGSAPSNRNEVRKITVEINDITTAI